jgi:hypothetical protein
MVELNLGYSSRPEIAIVFLAFYIVNVCFITD